MSTIYRTKEQRISEVKPIIKKLTELNIKASEHEEIRELLQKIQFDTSSDDAILKELVKHLQFGNISSLFDNLTEEEFEDDTDYSYEWRESD